MTAPAQLPPHPLPAPRQSPSRYPLSGGAGEGNWEDEIWLILLEFRQRKHGDRARLKEAA